MLLRYHLCRLKQLKHHVSQDAMRLSLHTLAGLLQLSSLQTAVVDYCSTTARTERRCSARLGPIVT